MAFQVKGKLFKIFEAQQITERFRKREFVVEIDDGRYPQFVQFQMTGDRCENLDAHQAGDEVEMEFDLRGREWTSPQGDIRYFNSLEVWRLGPAAGASAQGPGPEVGQASQPQPGGPNPPPLTDDDVPF